MRKQSSRKAQHSFEGSWTTTTLDYWLDHWASVRPEGIAVIQHEDGRHLTFRELVGFVDAAAREILRLGVRAGDRVAAILELTLEEVVVMYACFRVGAVFVPIDVRLNDEETSRQLSNIAPQMLFVSSSVREKAVGRRVPPGQRWHVATVLTLEAPATKPGGEESASPLLGLFQAFARHCGQGDRAAKTPTVRTDTPCLIIHTTGTTGWPKPALLSHGNILAQNEVVRQSMRLDSNSRMLINWPPSHVGGTTACLLSTLYSGGTCVLMSTYDPVVTAECIGLRRINRLGQFNAQLYTMWTKVNPSQFDFTSLEYLFFGGSIVEASFVEKLSHLAKFLGTGYGLTEGAGLCVMTPWGAPPKELVEPQVGTPLPHLADISIREPMKPGGAAGKELPDGTIGEICCRGPVVFLGYYGQPEETQATISTDRYLYTGDMGFFRVRGSVRTLVLSGRRKHIIKQKGYNVFPDEVAAEIARFPGVEAVEVVGVPHRLLGDGVFAYVRPKQGVALLPDEILASCRRMTSYKRPAHVEIWPAERPFPLARTAKTDHEALRRMALATVEALREQGGWDACAC